MSRKKAKSNLPSELNENWGSNYMMDGFWHDMEYEHGLKENPGANPVPQPSTGGMAQLPGNVIVGESDINDLEVPEGVEKEQEGGLELGELGIVANDRADVGITDFTWLGDATQDPHRLPINDVDNMIPELQEAWGNRTDGIHRIDLVDRDAIKYQDAFQGEEDDDTLHVDKLASFVRSAMRRSAAGDLSFAQKCAKHPKMAKPMQAIKAEHGLTGNVYVRASAYPRLHQGKYAKEFKKAAKGCRYLVAQDTGFFREAAKALNLRLVTDASKINWKSAYKHYGPRLAATGRLKWAGEKLPKSYRRLLQAAFLSDEVAPRTHIETTKVKHTMPVDRVSSEEARLALAAYEAPAREVIQTAAPGQEQKLRFVKKLGSMVKANLITDTEAKKILSSDASLDARIRMAEILAASSSEGSFKGHQFKDPNVLISEEDFRQAGRDGRHVHQARVASAQMGVNRHRLLDNFVRMASQQKGALKKAQQIIRAVRKGVSGDALISMVNSTFSVGEHRLVASYLDPFLVKGGYFKDNPLPRSVLTDHRRSEHWASDQEAQKHTASARKAQQKQDAKVAKAAKKAAAHRREVENLLAKVARVESLVAKGVRGSSLREAVTKMFTASEHELVYLKLDPILVKGGFYEKEASSEYEGPVLTRAQQSTPDMAVSPKEVRKAARWVRQQMSEGSAGEQLDQLIQIRLSPKLAQAAGRKIKLARQAHEGLSGHLYVDAGAYGTKSGTKGCDKGALRHRANQLKFVLAQKQCQRCVFKNADGVCQKYNKMVVDEIPENVDGYRQQMIASHAKTDQEMTADLFNLPSMEAATNPVSDFGLHNGTLDDIETSDSPLHEQVDGIFFGGFEI
jgi:hypothetical protein